MKNTDIAAIGKPAAVLCLIGLALLLGVQPARAERRGAELVLGLTDGSTLQGELIAVHEQLLIVQVDGAHLAFKLDKISRLTVRKDSKSREWMEYGSVIGLEAAEDLHGSAGGDAILSAIVFGALGSLIGAGLGALDGLDEHYSLEVLTTTKQRAELLRHLSGLARFRSDR
jgi:hypothetical protein